MNAGKTILAALVGGIAYFLLGWLVWGIALKSTLALPAETAKVIQNAEMSMLPMLLSCLTWGGFLAYIYAKWANIGTFSSGAIAGATIALFVSITTNLGILSQYNFVSTTQAFTDIVASVIATGITGGIVGWMLGRGTVGDIVNG
jgi:hypothetical protein